MPSQQDNILEKGFHSSLFGFDKNDVLAYLNALTDEAQQNEQNFRQTISELQAQVVRLKTEQSKARVCTEKLQSELTEAVDRAETAEKERDALRVQLEESNGQLKESQSRNRVFEQQAQDWQKKLDEAKQEAEQTAKTIYPQTPENARIEARRILADARVRVQTAEEQLKKQQDEQKRRMADHAEGLAAGVAVLRTRLSYVDEKLNAASEELENATAAIYEALDQTNQDLVQMGVSLKGFGEVDFEAPAAEKPKMNAAPNAQEPKAEQQRAKAAVRIRPNAKIQAAKAANAPYEQEPQRGRLRGGKPARSPETSSQYLLDAIDRLKNS